MWVMPQAWKNAAAGQEARAGRGFLVAVDLAVGEAGVVVDGGVDVVEAHPASGGPAGLAAQGLVAATVGDMAELLHVDVDEFAGAVAFVAADHLAGGPVHERQPVQAVADQDAVHGRGGQVQQGTEAGGAKFAVLTQLADPSLHHCRRAVGCCLGAAGPVVQPPLTLGLPKRAILGSPA